MKRVVVVAVLLMLAASLPACAAYQVNWSDSFNWGPFPPAPSPWVVNNMQLVDSGIGGSSGLRQIANATPSDAYADLRSLNSQLQTYMKGYAKFWVYDPGDQAGLVTDAKAGVFSGEGADSTGSMFTAGLSSSRSHDYWTIQWSSTVFAADGLNAPSGTGFSFTAGPAAPRVSSAWSSVMVSWDFQYTAAAQSQGTGTVRWYINQSSIPNATLNFSDLSARWANSHDVAGVFIGTLGTQSRPATYDNVEFHGNLVPEPSSLLALTGGMIGLLGLIRRRR